MIQLYDGKTGDRVGELPVEHDGSVFSLAWSDDGARLLSASGDKTCKLWDVAAQKCISTFKLRRESRASVRCMCVLLTSGFPRERNRFGDDTDDQQVGALCQGEFMLSVSLSGHINYLDVNNPNKPHRVLYGHQKFITSLAYDGSKKEFFTGSYDSVITRWSETSGESRGFQASDTNVVSVSLLTCHKMQGKGHTSQINGIAVQAGNLVTASTDSSLRVTALASMEYATAFGTDTDAVGVAVGQKDTSLVFAACLDGVVKVQSGGSVQKQTHKVCLSCIVHTYTCTHVISFTRN